MPIYMPSLPNYERYNPFEKFVDPGGPRENAGLSHLSENIASLLHSVLPSPGSTVSINPQPLPPGEMLQPSYLNPGSLVSLNPQPLPPEPPVESLWNTSAVLFGGSEVGILPPYYHGPTPDPAPWSAVGAWLR